MNSLNIETKICFLIITFAFVMQANAMTELPVAPRDLGTWCSPEWFERNGRTDCEAACAPAMGKCDGDPRTSPANCDGYSACQILSHDSRTTSKPITEWTVVSGTTFAPRIGGTTTHFPIGATGPTGSPVPKGSNNCGPGTKFVNGKCEVAYTSLTEMCGMAMTGNWGWSCAEISQCPTT